MPFSAAVDRSDVPDMAGVFLSKTPIDDAPTDESFTGGCSGAHGGTESSDRARSMARDAMRFLLGLDRLAASSCAVRFLHRTARGVTRRSAGGSSLVGARSATDQRLGGVVSNSDRYCPYPSASSRA